MKHAREVDGVIPVRCRSASLTNGRVRAVKYYTAETVDWIAVYEANSAQCYYVPSTEFATGRSILSLRVAPARNRQRLGIRWAADYLAFWAADSRGRGDNG